jgi:hypothetical protein
MGTRLDTGAWEALSEEDLAKIAQNPVGNLISVPFQENMNLNTGPLERTQNVLNIQPVIPISLSSDWNIITRTIVPIISQPGFAPDQNRTNGIGDVQFTAFLAPAKPGAWIWGVGVITQLPTHSNDRLGNNNAGLGPAFVILHLAQGDPWVYGVLVNNIWSVSHSASPSYSNGLVQPFVGWPVLHELTHLQRELAGQGFAAMDRTDGWRSRQDLSFRQTAGQHTDIRALQPGPA